MFTSFPPPPLTKSANSLKQISFFIHFATTKDWHSVGSSIHNFLSRRMNKWVAFGMDSNWRSHFHTARWCARHSNETPPWARIGCVETKVGIYSSPNRPVWCFPCFAKGAAGEKMERGLEPPRETWRIRARSLNFILQEIGSWYKFLCNQMAKPD